MAHAEKYVQTSVTGLAIHYERRDGCELSNKDIDKTRTHLNYNLAQYVQPLRTEEFVSQRLSEVKHIKRKDIIVMVDWIITLPKNVPTEDEGKFFEYTFDFMKQKYGEQNIVGAWVHKDETTPHIHVAFVPVIKEDGIEKLNCKKIITKQMLKQFHPELAQYLDTKLGYLPEVQNDATINGNRTIKELKNQEDLSMKKSIKNINEHLSASDEIVTKANEIDFEPSGLLEKTRSLKKCNQVIDELKHVNKQLQADTNSLSNLVVVQKREIDGYRKMPLAKQVKEKEEVIHNLYSSISSLENEIDDYKDDYQNLRENNFRLDAKVEHLEKEVTNYQSFVSMMGLDKVFEVFKAKFKVNYSMDIRTLKDLCAVAKNTLTNMFEMLKARIEFLDKRNVPNEAVRMKKHSWKDRTR